jgi:glutathione peroxidase
MNSIYDIAANTLSGDQINLSEFHGKVLLIVNTASHCGFTGQYEGLEALYRQYKDQGLAVLGFPCNQFGAQEPGTAEDIGAFCEKNYGVSFPMFEKIDVNGPNAHPLYQLLKNQAPGVLGTEGIKWNFTKFLVSRDGEVHGRYAPTTRPADLERDVQDLLKSQPTAA